MKPRDFMKFDGNSSPNTPVYKIAEAMQKDIVIRGESIDYIILSYYYDVDICRMVLDIQPTN